MDDKQELLVIDEDSIKDRIYEIRGIKVMLDFDLAEIYGYETKYFNRQVKNNIEKFPVDFMFELSNKEYELILRCKKCTSNRASSKRRYNPYAFTEQGIYMLMTVLKGELATKQSIAIIRTFKAMKDYLIDKEKLFSFDNVLHILNKVNEHDSKLINLENKLSIIANSFVNNNEKEFLILNNQRIKADILFNEIYSKPKESIIVIDNYLGPKTFELLKATKENVQITIISNLITSPKTNLYINDFMLDTKRDIKLIESDIFHDRYLVIDFKCKNEIIYHSGSSSKDSGNKITHITMLEDIDIFNDAIEKILSNK